MAPWDLSNVISVCRTVPLIQFELFMFFVCENNLIQLVLWKSNIFYLKSLFVFKNWLYRIMRVLFWAFKTSLYFNLILQSLTLEKIPTQHSLYQLCIPREKHPLFGRNDSNVNNSQSNSHAKMKGLPFFLHIQQGA